jgi:hypothetical protein
MGAFCHLDARELSKKDIYRILSVVCLFCRTNSLPAMRFLGPIKIARAVTDAETD